MKRSEPKTVAISENTDHRGRTERELENLRKLIAEGDASGDYQEVDFVELLADCEF